MRYVSTHFKKHLIKCHCFQTNFNKHIVKLRYISTNFKKHLVKLTSKLTNLRKHLAKLQLFPQACLKGFLNCLCEMKGIVQVGTHQSSRSVRAPARPCPKLYRVFRSRRSAISGIDYRKIRPLSVHEFNNTAKSIVLFQQTSINTS